MTRFPADIKEFIDSAKWTFAKTYAHTWPHHYIVKDRVDNQELFLQTVKHIRCYGHEGPFYNKEYIYFEEDGLVYWTMGAPIDETTVINRWPKENTYEYRLKTKTLPK